MNEQRSAGFSVRIDESRGIILRLRVGASGRGMNAALLNSAPSAVGALLDSPADGGAVIIVR